MRDTFLGCLLGCAVGDALGAPFEGMWARSIPDEAELMSGFSEFIGYPLGQYTDDTQLTLATMESILEQRIVSPHDIAGSIANLWKRQEVIGPGGACTRAAVHFLAHGDWQSCGAPVGQAGNGTAMRTAAIGLCFLNKAEQLPQAAADISRITHADPRSIAGGVAIAMAAYLLAKRSTINAGDFCKTISNAMRPYHAEFAELVEGIPRILQFPEPQARQEIAWAGLNRPEFEESIITPFVVPTVLASLWMVLRFPESWSSAVASVIRLGGDVDTLGAIVGALMGARVGVSGIPPHLVESVVNRDRIMSLAIQCSTFVNQAE